MLLGRLMEWDGKSAAYLKQLAEDQGQASGYLEDVIHLCHDPNPRVHTGATWLLKHAIGRGAQVPFSRVKDAVHPQISWEARLHIFQSLSAMDLTSDQVGDLVPVIQEALTSKRAILRAWALDALYRCALVSPEVEGLWEVAASQAMAKEKASVKARLRNILAEDQKRK